MDLPFFMKIYFFTKQKLLITLGKLNLQMQDDLLHCQDLRLSFPFVQDYTKDVVSLVSFMNFFLDYEDDNHKKFWSRCVLVLLQLCLTISHSLLSKENKDEAYSYQTRNIFHLLSAFHLINPLVHDVH